MFYFYASNSLNIKDFNLEDIRLLYKYFTHIHEDINFYKNISHIAMNNLEYYNRDLNIYIGKDNVYITQGNSHIKYIIKKYSFAEYNLKLILYAENGENFELIAENSYKDNVLIYDYDFSKTIKESYALAYPIKIDEKIIYIFLDESLIDKCGMKLVKKNNVILHIPETKNNTNENAITTPIVILSKALILDEKIYYIYNNDYYSVFIDTKNKCLVNYINGQSLFYQASYLTLKSFTNNIKLKNYKIIECKNIHINWLNSKYSKLWTRMMDNYFIFIENNPQISLYKKYKIFYNNQICFLHVEYNKKYIINLNGEILPYKNITICQNKIYIDNIFYDSYGL
jgi:hypothetical protein